MDLFREACIPTAGLTSSSFEVGTLLSALSVLTIFFFKNSRRILLVNYIQPRFQTPNLISRECSKQRKQNGETTADDERLWY